MRKVEKQILSTCDRFYKSKVGKYFQRREKKNHFWVPEKGKGLDLCCSQKELMYSSRKKLQIIIEQIRSIQSHLLGSWRIRNGSFIILPKKKSAIFILNMCCNNMITVHNIITIISSSTFKYIIMKIFQSKVCLQRKTDSLFFVPYPVIWRDNILDISTAHVEYCDISVYLIISPWVTAGTGSSLVFKEAFVRVALFDSDS